MRIRPRTHDDPPVQPLSRRECPPPVQHTAETNFRDEADTWWCVLPITWGGSSPPSWPGSGRLVEVVLVDAKANTTSDHDASTSFLTHNDVAKGVLGH
jgi:hypothetical protein